MQIRGTKKTNKTKQGALKLPKYILYQTTTRKQTNHYHNHLTFCHCAFVTGETNNQHHDDVVVCDDDAGEDVREPVYKIRQSWNIKSAASGWETFSTLAMICPKGHDPLAPPVSLKKLSPVITILISMAASCHERIHQLYKYCGTVAPVYLVKPTALSILKIPQKKNYHIVIIALSTPFLRGPNCITAYKLPAQVDYY